jgi:peroxiredoxin
MSRDRTRHHPVAARRFRRTGAGTDRDLYDDRNATEPGPREGVPGRIYPAARPMPAMVSTGDTAPTFTATLGTSDHESFDLADHLGDGPVVLAFFPGAFTPPCTNEMVAFQERLDEFEAAGATILGVSADSPFSQGAFREEHGIEFDLVSDMAGEAIGAYDLDIDIPELGLHGIANRAVFVVDEDGTVVYAWEAEDPTNEPDYDAVLAAVEG